MNRILIIIMLTMILVSSMGITYAYNNSQQKVNYIISANWLKPPENKIVSSLGYKFIKR